MYMNMHINLGTLLLLFIYLLQNISCPGFEVSRSRFHCPDLESWVDIRIQITPKKI